MSTIQYSRNRVCGSKYLLLLILFASTVVHGHGDVWTEEEELMQIAAEESCEEWLTIYGDCMEASIAQVVDPSAVCVEERADADACVEDELNFIRSAAVTRDQHNPSTTGQQPSPSGHPESPPNLPPPAPAHPTPVHTVKDIGLRLSLVRPLHWEVIPTDGRQANIIAIVHGLSWPIPAQLHAEMMLNLNSNRWALSAICGQRPDGQCPIVMTIDPEKLGTHTHSFAMRLVSLDDPWTSIGPVTEISFRTQPKHEGTWSDSSCSKGFFDGPPPHQACLGDPLSRPVSQMASPEALAAWLIGAGVAPDAAHRQAEAMATGGALELLEAASLGAAQREALQQDAALREAWATGPWYPTHAAARVPGAQASSCARDAACAPSAPQRAAAVPCPKGSGPVMMVIGVAKHADPALRAAVVHPPALPALNASAGAPRELIWVVAAESPPAAARVLYRHAPRFKVVGVTAARRPAGAAQGGGAWLEEAAAAAVWAQVTHLRSEAETVCAFLGDGDDGRDGHDGGSARSAIDGWACAPSVDSREAVRRVAPLHQRPELSEADDVPVSFVYPRLYGLLGNVLWQAGVALALAWDLDAMRFHGRRWEVLLPEAQDPRQCGKTFQANLLSSDLLSRRPLHTVVEDDWYYLDEGTCHICFFNLTQGALAAPPGASILVRGWRNSYLYVQHHRRRLVDAFSLPPHLEDAAQVRYRQLLAALRDEAMRTVSVHVRRGDLKQENGTMLDMSYYEEAIRRMGKDNLFVIFSDDIEDMKQQPVFRDLPHAVFVQLGIDFMEFRIMAMCDDHIIANSTFSYWAAFLHAPPAWRPKRSLKRNRKRRKRSNLAGLPSTTATGTELRVWRGTRVVCPEVWGRGDSPESRFSVEELYPPLWNRVPNRLVSE